MLLRLLCNTRLTILDLRSFRYYRQGRQKSAIQNGGYWSGNQFESRPAYQLILLGILWDSLFLNKCSSKIGQEF